MPYFTSVIILLLGFVAPSSASRLRGSFDEFLPSFSAEISKIPEELAAYRNESVTLYGTKCVRTYSCIMEDVSEYTKANMASSTVLLGLTPWILSALGSTSSEISLLSARRPLLTFLLVLGSPAINPTRSGGYRDPFDEHLTYIRGQTLLRKLSPARNIVCVAVELILAMANIVNLATLSWKLALNTIPVMSCDSDMVVGLWVGLAFVTYMLGLATFFSRAKLPGIPMTSDRRTQRLKNCFRSRFNLITELHHGANQGPLDLFWDEETWMFLFLSWITTLFTITHLAFGTLVLSSLSFVGIEDATRIAARFMASAIINRKIIAYELAGMRSARTRVHKTDIDIETCHHETETMQTQNLPTGSEQGDVIPRAPAEVSDLKSEHRPARQGVAEGD